MPLTFGQKAFKKMEIYKLKSGGDLLRLKTIRQSGINTYIKVGTDFCDISEKQDWQHKPQTVTLLIKGFSRIEKLKIL